MYNKDSFKKAVQNGKWFKYKSCLVKYKYINNELVGLWLSDVSPDVMCFETYEEKDWDIVNGKFEGYIAGVYLFGEDIENSEDNIYNGNGELIIDKVKEVIFNSHDNKDFNLVTEDELDYIWGLMMSNNLQNFEVLEQ